MAACSFRASGFKISSLNFRSTGPKLAALPSLHGLSMTNQKLVLLDGLRISLKPNKPLIGCLSSTSDTSENSPEDAKSSTAVSKLIPNSFEVESLVTDICDTTSIAEFELKLGGFQLYVKRNLTHENTTLPAPVSAPITVTAALDLLPNTNGSAPSTSLAIHKSDAPGDIQTLLDKATDHGIAILKSPWVGYFRRSRTIKGKPGPPSVKENQHVREGQIICFIDQFGGEIPVESDIGGEVIKILREDGEPVGYGDALIAILPSFPGIKKLQ